jgi:hypothetical protein
MASTSPQLTRRQVASLLNVSESEVKKQDNAVLHPTNGSDGSWRYAPEEVAAVLRGLVGGDSDPEPTGAVCAAAFELFEAGKKLTEAVIALKQPPGLVRSLRSEYDEMIAGLTITPASVALMAQALQTPIRNEEQLVSLVADLGQRLGEEYQRGYDAGLADANDPGEIVDPTTGRRRPLKLDDVAAGSKIVKERWGRTDEGKPRPRSDGSIPPLQAGGREQREHNPNAPGPKAGAQGTVIEPSK